MKKKLFSIGAALASVFLLPAITFASGAFYVDTSGNIGVGNTTPQSPLDVSGSLYSRLDTVTDSASTTIDWNAGNVASITLNTGSTVLSFSNGQAGGEYKLIAVQDGTGSRTITWPSSVLWPGGTTPVLTTTAGASDVFSFVYDGSHYLGSSSLNYESSAPAPITYFSDDFHRADGSIGNGWTPNCQGSGATIGISSNTLQLYGNNNGDCEFYRTDVSETSGIAITNTFSATDLGDADGSGTRGYGILGTVPTSSYHDLFKGYGYTFSNAGVISIMDNGNALASTTTTFNDTDQYTIEMDITASPQNWVHLYVWDSTTGSKPSSPTLSWTNGGSDYTPAASGTALYGNYEVNSYSHNTFTQYLYKVTSL